jgi:hypothetical protein
MEEQEKREREGKKAFTLSLPHSLFRPVAVVVTVVASKGKSSFIIYR